MVLTKKVERTPYEIWHGKALNMSYLRVWGCEALVKRDILDKLNPRSIKCIFVGYPKEMMGYYFYYPLENKIFVAQNVKFFENSLMAQEASGSHGLLESSGSDGGLELIHEEDTQPSENTSEIHNDVAPIEVEPKNVKVLIHPEFDKWLEAMNTEMQSMKDNQVWVLLDLPPNGRTVRSKWLFKKKTDMDGNIHTFKARLVAKGYTQTYGVDYGETFSPVADIKAIRILLAIVAFYDYEIWQMDIKTAFLNGHLSEDVYIVQHEAFVDPKHSNKVCKLQRSIYGLKQASRSWNKRFDVEIKKIGFTQNPDEPCVYLKASRSNVVILILYVDDVLLTGNNVTMLQEVKSWLCKCFSMKDLGEAAYILGIKIIHDRSKRLIALSQSAYLEKILKRFWMENSKKGYTSMIEKPDYKKSQGAKTPSEVQRMQRVPYALAIGSIIYATTIKAILKYLRNTKDMVLVYRAKPEAELKKSDKQSTTPMTSKEAKYIAVAEASMEAVWMRKFIDRLGGVVPSNKRPMEMLCDNEPTIAIANDPGILKGARDFQRKYHYICEVIQKREIVLKKVHTDDNVAAPFTKPMSYDKHYKHAMAIGIVPDRSVM
ncbi:retrotransposon protein, putative, ty1-copia subclass [Tanacetum coccineum]